MMICRRQKGFSLIELIISIVVFSIAMGGLLSFFSAFSSHSADPMLQEQAVAIAEAYMEEIMLQEYEDPVNEATDAEGINRGIYNDVDDYNGLQDTLVRDQNDDLIPSLAAFRVVVAVTGGGGAPQRVDVTVSHQLLSNLNLMLTSLRYSY